MGTLSPNHFTTKEPAKVQKFFRVTQCLPVTRLTWVLAKYADSQATSWRVWSQWSALGPWAGLYSTSALCLSFLLQVWGQLEPIQKPTTWSPWKDFLSSWDIKEGGGRREKFCRTRYFISYRCFINIRLYREVACITLCIRMLTKALLAVGKINK